MVEYRENGLVERIRNGDRKAENELITRFGNRISRKVTLSLGQSGEDWKDVVCEVQMALLVSLREGRYDPDRGVSLASYVYGITMNKVRDYFKARSRNSTVTFGEPDEYADRTAEEYEIERRETRDILRELLKKLKVKYKEVLYLKYYEELSVAEISAKISMPPRRVSERLNYGVKLLRKECERENIFSILRSFVLIYV